MTKLAKIKNMSNKRQYCALTTPTLKKGQTSMISCDSNPSPAISVTPFLQMDPSPSQQRLFPFQRSLFTLNPSMKKLHSLGFNEQAIEGIQGIINHFNQYDDEEDRNANRKYQEAEDQIQAKVEVKVEEEIENNDQDEEYNRALDYYFNMATEILEQLRNVERYLEQERKAYDQQDESVQHS